MEAEEKVDLDMSVVVPDETTGSHPDWHELARETGDRAIKLKYFATFMVGFKLEPKQDGDPEDEHRLCTDVAYGALPRFSAQARAELMRFAAAKLIEDADELEQRGDE